MSKTKTNKGHILPQLQRRIAKMGRLASGSGKTIRSTKNSKKINSFSTG